MALTNKNNDNRTILLTGKTGTGKSTKALTFVSNPIILYADDADFDIGSFPVENGIVIEDVHYKPDKSSILHIMRNYQGQVVLTSINQKSVPKEIKDMCRIKRAGSRNFLEEEIKELAPNSESPFSLERDTYSIVNGFLKERNRDLVAEILLFNKPSDTQILSWLSENMHPNRLIFVDGRVKRRWNQRYFYEMLAYSHVGGFIGQLNMPKRRAYSQLPRLSRRLGVKNQRLLPALLKDDVFKEHAKKKLNNAECRLLKIGEKRRRKKTTPIEIKQTSLGDFF